MVARLRVILVVSWALAVSVRATSQASTNPVGPLDYARSILQQASAIVGRNQTHDQKVAALSVLFGKFLDTDAMARDALGQHWSSFTPAQQKEFLPLFRALIEKACGRAPMLVHYSGFRPKCWRFPFMAPANIQIGDTWTHPQHRGNGIARYALQEILNRFAEPGRQFWYVVEHRNGPSIKVAENVGMTMVATGEWTQLASFWASGSLVINQRVTVSEYKPDTLIGPPHTPMVPSITVQG